jgi:hypothetical protein
MYYIKALSVVIALPLLPLTLAGTLALPLIRFSVFSKRLKLFVIVSSSLLLLGFVLAVIVINNDITRVASEGLTPDLGLIITRMTAYYPPGLWTGKAIVFPTAHGTLHLFHFLLLSGTALYAFSKFAVPVYLKRTTDA